MNIPDGASTIPGHVSSHKSSNTGAIAGGIVGGLVVLGVLGGGIVYFLRKRRPAQWDSEVADKIKSSRNPAGFLPVRTFEPFSDSPRAQTPSLVYTHGPSSGPSAADTNFILQSPYDRVSDNAHEPHIVERQDSTYLGSAFTTGATVSYLGRSISQGGSVTSSGTSSYPVQDVQGSGQAIFAKQSIVHEELRSEVDNLRRDIDQIRQEREVLGEAPPQYTDTI